MIGAILNSAVLDSPLRLQSVFPAPAFDLWGYDCEGIWADIEVDYHRIVSHQGGVLEAQLLAVL